MNWCEPKAMPIQKVLTLTDRYLIANYASKAHIPQIVFHTYIHINHTSTHNM